MRYWALIGAVALAVAAYVGYYAVVASVVVGAIEDWTEARRAEGRVAAYAGLERRGFPYRVVVDIARPRLAMADDRNAPAWEADRLSAVIQPWDFHHVILDLTGRHRLGPVAAGPGRQVLLELEIGNGLASHRQDGTGRLRDLAIDLKQLAGSLEIRAGGVVRPASIVAERVQLHLRPAAARDTIGEVSLRADRLAVGDAAWMAPLDRLDLLASVLGPEPPLGDIGAMVLAWRDGGGAVEIRELTVVWGEVEIRAEGTLALDAETRLVGAMTAKVKGHRELLERAVLAGVMRRADADEALPILNLLALVAGGELSVPVTMQDGRLSLGPITVARLTPILLPPPAAGGGRNPVPASPARRQ